MLRCRSVTLPLLAQAAGHQSVASLPPPSPIRCWASGHVVSIRLWAGFLVLLRHLSAVRQVEGMSDSTRAHTTALHRPLATPTGAGAPWSVAVASDCAARAISHKRAHSPDSLTDCRPRRVAVTHLLMPTCFSLRSKAVLLGRRIKARQAVRAPP